MQKPGLTAGHRISVLVPPPNIAEILGPLPAGSSVVSEGCADLVRSLAQNLAGLNEALPKLAAVCQQGARLWIAYAKLTSPLATDLNRSILDDLALRHGLDVVAQIALDLDWTGLRCD